jgi:hypothetical protein
MKYKFFIHGISCGNCVEKITKLLTQELNAFNLNFSSNNTQLSFDSTVDTNIRDLNLLLAKIGNYTLDVNDNGLSPLSENQDQSSYKPIYLIFTYLLFINIVICYKGMWMDFMANFMASFFLVFSFFKMLDLKGFADGYSSYDIVAKKFHYYGYVYPFIELGFGIAYILFATNIYLNIAVFFVMLISTIGVVKAKLTKQQFHCVCVGTLLKVPLGSLAIIEGVSMVLMSLLMIIQLTNFKF